MNEIQRVGRFRLYFSYAIDLAHLLSPTAIELLMQLRARNEVENLLNGVLSSDTSTADHLGLGYFYFPQNKELQIQDFKANIDKQKENGGKNIWSTLFLNNYVPYTCDEIGQKELVPQDGDVRGGILPNSQLSQGTLGLDLDNAYKMVARYIRCQLRVMPDGTLTVTFSFDFDDEVYGEQLQKLQIDDFIKLILRLENLTSDAFFYRVRDLTRVAQEQSHPFKEATLSFEILSNSSQDKDKVRQVSANHTVIFVEAFYEEDGETEVQHNNIHDARSILGILNQSQWYRNYSDNYVSKILDNDVGYRNDEKYLIDNRTSLIWQAEYWKRDKSARFYEGDLLVLIEFMLSKVAILQFITDYLQADRSFLASFELVSDEETRKLVNRILLARRVLLLIEEAINIEVLVVHGFTRKFLRKFYVERATPNLLQAINQKITHMDNAISLKASYDLTQQGNLLNRRNIFLAFAAIFVSAILAIIQVLVEIYQVFNP